MIISGNLLELYCGSVNEVKNQMKDYEFPKFPILVYDNLCSSCTKYAKLADLLMSHKVKVIGLWSGEEISKVREILKLENIQGWSEMSWFITKDMAYGGRAALFRMIKYILFERDGSQNNNKFNTNECTTDCMTVKGVWFRSMSILTRAKKIPL